MTKDLPQQNPPIEPTAFSKLAQIMSTSSTYTEKTKHNSTETTQNTIHVRNTNGKKLQVYIYIKKFNKTDSAV